MINYLNEVERNYANAIKTIVNTRDGSECQLVAQLAEHATGEQMDYSSITCISRNEVGTHIIRTYAMKRMDGNVFVITLEYAPDNWSLQGNTINTTPTSNNTSWGDAANFY